VKYSADPNPVRSADGIVPRQRLRMGCGDARIPRMVVESEAVCVDCCTRVFRRSAGCKRMEEVRPDARPARKWNVVFEAARREKGVCQSEDGSQKRWDETVASHVDVFRVDCVEAPVTVGT
jgi:hypothetical protein